MVVVKNRTFSLSLLIRLSYYRHNGSSTTWALSGALFDSPGTASPFFVHVYFEGHKKKNVESQIITQR